MRRSEFVTVPSFSPRRRQATTHGRALSCRYARCNPIPRRNHIFWSAARTRSASGRLTTGFVAHDPDRLDPALVDRFEQLDRLEARPGRHPRTAPELLNLRAMERIVQAPCARRACWPCHPLPDRPWHWVGPVRENGPIPGRPIRPVSRWQLMMLLTLSVPAEDWFTPCEKAVTTRSVAANRR